MSRRSGPSWYLVDPSYSGRDDIPMSMRTEQTESIQQATRERHTTNTTYQNYPSYPGYQVREANRGYEGFESFIPGTFHYYCSNNRLPGCSCRAGQGQASSADGCPLRSSPMYYRMSPVGYPMIKSSGEGSTHQVQSSTDTSTPPKAIGTAPGEIRTFSQKISTKPRINPEAPSFVPSIAAGDTERLAETNYGNVHKGQGHLYGQEIGARQPTDLDEYAKKLERWIGMEDDDEFIYFDEEIVPMKPENTQQAR